MKKEKSKGWEWGSWWGGIKISPAKIALITLKRDGDKSMFQFVFERYTKKEERSCLFHITGIESSSSLLETYKLYNYNVDIQCESLKQDDILLLVGCTFLLAYLWNKRTQIKRTRILPLKT